MLLTCSHCEGFVPPNAAACPHCGRESLDVKRNSKFGALAKGIAAAASGGVVAVTLMACYGAPFIDNDHDGFDGNYEDCNDNDAATHPGAPDSKGDGVDQNCDGVDGIAPDAGPDGESSSSSGGMCVSCAQAVGSTGLVAPPAQFCTPAGQQAFDALKTCACTVSCSADCGANTCQGMPATAACSTCVMTNCSTQNLACSEN